MENVYTRKATVRSERGSAQHEITITFNMDGAKEEDIIEAALRSKVIDVQAALRRLSPKELADVVKDAPKNASGTAIIHRTFKEPGKGIESMEKKTADALDMFKGMNAEQKKAFLAALKNV